MGNKQYDRQNQFNREHYARLSINVPQERRPVIDAHWKSKGYTSFNKYVIDLINKDIENNGGISVGDITQTGDNNSINIG